MPASTMPELTAPPLEWALWYAAHGWYVFPCHTPTVQGCSCHKQDCPDIGKHPRTEHGLHDATVNTATIQRWWGSQWPDANIGLRTGAISRIVVLDEDTYKGGDIRTLTESYTALPETVEQLTGGGGRQLLFQHPGSPIKNSVEDLGIGLDIRGDGGYIIVPPSLHHSGNTYRWEITHEPCDLACAPMPPWLQALCSTPARSKTSFTDMEAPILKGSRNDTLFRQGCSMRSRGFSEAAIYGALLAINDTQCLPPLETEDIRKLANSCARYDITHPLNGTTTPATATPAAAPTTPFGDIYYAEWFIKIYGDRWRYCALWKSWLHWIGTHWERDTNNYIMEDARATLRAVGHMAIDTDNKELLKHYSRSMNHQPLLRMLQQASSLPGVSIDPSILDQHPWLLNCRNGTLNLQTGQLGPHEKTHYLTRCLSIDYDPEALAPTWQQFLWRIMGGTVEPDAEDESIGILASREEADARANRLITFLQRALGYACSGDTSEECLFLFHGSGRNGKSKLLTTMQKLLGPYAKTADMQSFLHKDRETVRNDLADLNATRLVCASEVNEGSRFAEGLIKQLTGGDRIKARFLFQEYFEFQPEFKLFLAFNHKPTIRGTDDAIWTRIKLVPFVITIPPEEQDKHLSDKLLRELPGILAWCVKGCLAWQADGLSEPPEVVNATQEYRQESDYVQRFLEDCCHMHPDMRTESTMLYSAYKRWCEDNGEYVQNQTRFGRDLTAKKFVKVPGHGNRQFREGIGLRDTGPF